MPALPRDITFLQAASQASPELQAALQEQQKLSAELLADQQVRAALFECSALIKTLLHFAPALEGQKTESEAPAVPDFFLMVFDARGRLNAAEELLRDNPEMQRTFGELCRITDQVLRELEQMFTPLDN